MPFFPKKSFLGIGHWAWATLGAYSFALALTYAGLRWLVWARMPHYRYRSMDYAALFKREKAIEEELKALGGRHAWAGIYSGGIHFFSIAPKSGYIFYLSSDIGGSNAIEQGAVAEDEGWISFVGTHQDELKGSFFPVRWGERAFLISGQDMMTFINEVNAGGEPHYDAFSIQEYFSRSGDRDKPALGKPVLPPGLGAYLLDRPIDARIIAMGAPLSRAQAERPEFTRAILLNAGRRAGVFEGMIFHPRGEKIYGKAVVEHVSETASAARYEMDRREPGARAPKIDMELSTRYEGARGISPWASPFRLSIRRLESQKFSPFNGVINRLFRGQDYFNGAKENGFKVLHLARLDASALDAALITGDEFGRRVESMGAAMGANVCFFQPSDFKRNTGPWRASTTADFYRVEWDSQPLEYLDFIESGGHYDKAAWSIMRERLKKRPPVRADVIVGLPPPWAHSRGPSAARDESVSSPPLGPPIGSAPKQKMPPLRIPPPGVEEIIPAELYLKWLPRAERKRAEANTHAVVHRVESKEELRVSFCAGGAISAIYGPRDETSREISLNLKPVQGNGHPGETFQVCDLSPAFAKRSPPWEIVCREFPVGLDVQEYRALDDRVPGNREYFLEVQRRRRDTWFRIGRPGYEGLYQTTLSELLWRKSQGVNSCPKL